MLKHSVFFYPLWTATLS